MKRRSRWMAGWLVGGACLALTFLAVARAGDEPKQDHLRFCASYGQAMLEARIRNMPIFVSRHKDF